MIFSLTDIDGVAHTLLDMVKSNRLVALHGDLGAGKTTLVGALCRQLGVAQAVTSPTFAYLNRYAAADGTPVYHFDLYRLKDERSFFVAGFDEYLANQNAYIFVEWPEIIDDIIRSRALDLTLLSVPDNSEKRELVIGNRL